MKMLGTVSVAGLFVLATIVLNPIADSTEGASATTGTATAATTSLTLSSQHSTASVALVATSQNGTFLASDANEMASFGVTTNNYTGYNLSIVASDDTGKLANEDLANNTTYYLNSIAANTTMTAFNSSSYNNKWGFAPSKYMSGNTVITNDTSNPTFLPGPTTTPTMLDKTNAANAASTSNEYMIGIGVRADYTTAPGDYSSTLTLIALANPVTYTVSFNKNTNDAVTNMPTSLSGSTSSTNVTIPNTAPVRANYTFAGWCSKKDALNTCPTGGNSYSAGDNYGIDQTELNETVLYAMWQPNYYMQDVAKWGKDLAIGESVQAIDRRDDKIYWVTKEETSSDNPRAEIDSTTGKAYQIWMTQNLDFDLDSTEALTPDTSDVTTSWTPTNSTLTDISNWVVNTSEPYSYDAGDYYYYTSGSVADDTIYSSLMSCVEANHSPEDCAHYSTGNYYNWNAAIANNDTSSITGNDTIQMPDSICPSGWRLPTGLTSTLDTGRTDFDYLLYGNGITSNYDIDGYGEDVGYTASGFNSIRISPLWFVRSGLIYNQSSSFTDGGVNSYYWANTPYGYNSNNTAKNLRFGASDIYPARGSTRNNGFSVRCIARNTMQESTIETIKAFTDNTIGNMTKLSDNRDGKTYAVTVGLNGTILMANNLNLAGGTTLTPADSNVVTNYTLPASSTVGFDSTTDPFVYNSNSIDCTSTPCYSYYNYVAATAGSNPTSGEPTQDICPKGWRLPTANDMRAFIQLYPTGADLTVAPWYGEYSGIYNHGSFSGAGSRGLYWPSTSYDAAHAYAVIFNSQSANVTNDDKYDGLAVRCILDGLASSVTSLQQLGKYDSATKTSIISTMVINKSYQLIDERDGKTYNIAKLADGKVWLQDNLALDLTDSDVQDNLSSSTTNASDATLNYLMNGGGTTSDQHPITGVANWTSGRSFSDPLIETTNKDTIGTGGYESGKYGIYYNFCAASAGSFCYGNGLNGGTPSGNATEDICPKGWRMPTGGSSGEYDALYTAYNSDYAGFVNALHTPLAGAYSDGATVAQAEAVSFWSSIYGGGRNMYSLSIDTSSVNSQNLVSRSYGYHVRCVIDTTTTISDINTMQQFGKLGPSAKASTLNSMVEGQAYSLTDSRDGQIYTVKKINNQIWMARNLAIGCDGSGTTYGSNASSKALTTYDSNIATDWSTPTAGLTISPSDYTTTARMDCSATYGAWYDFTAVTAGTITGDDDSNESVYDVCPVGWRLPTLAEQQSVTGYAVELNADTGGEYFNGAFSVSGRGLWWSSTARDGMNRYNLNYYGGTDFGIGTGCNRSKYGAYIRCVAK